jgi:hypothetical protein
MIGEEVGGWLEGSEHMKVVGRRVAEEEKKTKARKRNRQFLR